MLEVNFGSEVICHMFGYIDDTKSFVSVFLSRRMCVCLSVLLIQIIGIMQLPTEIAWKSI